MPNRKITRFSTSELNTKANKYLNEALNFLQGSLGEDLCSVILFGSHASLQSTSISDIDLLVVLKDCVDSRTMAKIARNLKWLELSTGLVKPPRGLERILRAIEVKTGMFICHFVCRRKDFITWRFAHVFSLNRFFAKLLAPGDLVQLGILASGITITGENLLAKVLPAKIGPCQIVKSFLMNSLQAINALLIAPLSSKATIYSIEAVKWSLLSSFAYANAKGMPVQDALEFFRGKLHAGTFLASQLDQFRQLRESFHLSPVFVIKAPLTIFLVHKKVSQELKHRKKSHAGR